MPDITVYVECLATKLQGDVLQRLRLLNPFLLRTALPPIGSAEGQRVLGVERVGKRVVIALEGELFLVLHLMIAGRPTWLASRASLHLLPGREALAAADPGGTEVMTCDAADFAARLRAANHTLKRWLTDAHLFSGIGGAYADEILHRTKLSPILLTRKLDAAQIVTLLAAARNVLAAWTQRLRGEAAAKGWRNQATAFRTQLAVHGRYGAPCPSCAAPVQHIVHPNHETNYCARCQTGGKLLADRALSPLLKASWPKHIDEIE